MAKATKPRQLSLFPEVTQEIKIMLEHRDDAIFDDLADHIGEGEAELSLFKMSEEEKASYFEEQ